MLSIELMTLGDPTSQKSKSFKLF